MYDTDLVPDKLSARSAILRAFFFFFFFCLLPLLITSDNYRAERDKTGEKSILEFIYKAIRFYDRRSAAKALWEQGWENQSKVDRNFLSPLVAQS